jgi:hypothetical protein
MNLSGKKPVSFNTEKKLITLSACGLDGPESNVLIFMFFFLFSMLRSHKKINA